MSTRIGSQFAGYRVVSVLGSGGMGDVYLVENRRLNRSEALKVTQIRSDSESARRFSLEASTMASFDHPSIATVYDYGLERELAWYSMQYLAGDDLSAVGRLPLSSIFAIVAQIADALDYAHARGVIHRDVKPANIHVRRAADGSVERATMLDFGVAKVHDITSLTQDSSFVGTLTYAAPEAIGGDHSLPTVDQYSFACTIFELLTGSPPYPERTVAALIAAHCEAPIPAVSAYEPTLAAADPVFRKALAKDPGQRFVNCRELASALITALSQERARRGTADRPLVNPLPASGAPSRPRVARGPNHSGGRDATFRGRIVPILLFAMVVLVGAVLSRQLWAGAAASTSGNGSAHAASAPRTGESPVSELSVAAGATTGGSSAGSGRTWGMVIDPDGATYAFRNFAGSAAMLGEAHARWGYDPRTWGSVYFDSGCGAFAFPEEPAPEGSVYHFGLGPDRPSAERNAVAKSEKESGLRSRAIDTVCVGDLVQ